MKFKAQWVNWADELHIALILGTWADGSPRFAKRFVTEVELEQGAPIRPAMELPRQVAQSLIDVLYDAGLRPTNGQPTTEQIRALEYHLEDMRQLVFKPTDTASGEG